MTPQEGEKAPAFALPDQDGRVRSLEEYRGERVLLYFYPKDDTPGCTQEACAIRDAIGNFSDLGIVVLGVSADPVKKHAAFAKKYDLPFPLLSDPDHTVLEAYGVWQKKKFMGREYMGITRTSFLIGDDGRIEKVYLSVKPATHADEVLADAGR